MKKLLVLVLSFVFVVAMASVTFAVATTSVDGEVYIEWTDGAAFAGSTAGYLNFDLTKEFAEGVKAGVSIDVEPTTDEYYVVRYYDPADPALPIDAVAVPNGADNGLGEFPYMVPTTQNGSVYFDGAGWIELTYDTTVVTAKTSIGGNAANYDLGGEFDMTSAAGVQVVNTGLMEGLTGTLIVNDGSTDYNFLLKADYATDTLGLGFGYQSDVANNAMYVWGSYKLMDSLTLSGEYGMRTDLSAIEIMASYSAEPLTANAKVVTTTTDGYVFGTDIDTAYNNFATLGNNGLVFVVDASYQLSDALSVNGEVDYAMVDAWADNQMMSYSFGATDKLSDNLTVEASYSSYMDVSTIDLTATYVFAEGLEGALNYNMVGSDSTITASITASL